MTKEINFSDALIFATKKHKNQIRKDGTPYILHPIRVAMDLKDYGLEYQIAALFHDLLEDTDATEEDILKYSNNNVLEAVKLVTKPNGKYNSKKYIENILKNPISKAVKMADRIDNLRDSCFANIDFQGRYILNTKTYYKGKFGPLLDEELERVMEFYNKRISSVEPKIEKDSITDDFIYYELDSRPCFFKQNTRTNAYYKFNFNGWKEISKEEFHNYEDMTISKKEYLIDHINALALTSEKTEESKDYFEKLIKTL